MITCRISLTCYSSYHLLSLEARHILLGRVYLDAQNLLKYRTPFDFLQVLQNSAEGKAVKTAIFLENIHTEIFEKTQNIG